MEEESLDRQAFKAAFKKAPLKDGRISVEDLSEIFKEFDIEQPSSSMYKNFSRFFFYSFKDTAQDVKEKLKQQKNRMKQKQQQEGLHENDDSENENGSELEEGKEDKIKSMEEWENIAESYELDLEEALLYAELTRQKFRSEIWKRTCDLLTFQFYCSSLTGRSSYPLKDPGQQANVNLVIGEEPPFYDSFVHLKVKKVPFANKENPWARVRLSTKTIEESNKFKELWEGIYEMIKGFLEGELPDGLAFIDSIKIVTEEQPDYFEIRLTSENPTLNEMIFLLTNLADGVFKTNFKLSLEGQLDFNFDLGKLTAQGASVYDLITQDIRLKVKGKTSEYLTALKEMLVAADVFEGLSYLGDDQDTMQRIFLVSLYGLNINMRMNNPKFENPQKETLQQFFGLLGELQQSLNELEEEAPDVVSMIRNALNRRIEVELQCYEFKAEAEVAIKSLDTLFNVDIGSLDMGGMGGGYDSD